MKCAWRPKAGEPVCTSTADDENKYDLCADHFIEMKRRRAVKVEGWKVAAIEKDAERYAKLLDLHRAERAANDALLRYAVDMGDIAGDSRVVIVHGRTNSVLANVLTGSVKSHTIRVPGWKTADFLKGVMYEPIDGLSLEAANVYTTTFNDSLSECEDTTAIVI